MAVELKVREKGILILPKVLREKAGIKEGSTVLATPLDDGIVLSPKDTDVIERLLGLAKISKRATPNSVRRVRSMRSKVDREQGLAVRERF